MNKNVPYVTVRDLSAGHRGLLAISTSGHLQALVRGPANDVMVLAHFSHRSRTTVTEYKTYSVEYVEALAQALLELQEEHGDMNVQNVKDEKEIERLTAEIERKDEALLSIANNTCCEPCQEARLVALNALFGGEVLDAVKIAREALGDG